MRALTLILGMVLATYGGAGVLGETIWQNNEQVERIQCRLFLCTNAPLEWQAQQQLSSPGEENSRKAISLFRELLQRDSQDPYRWADLGEAFLEADQKEKARECYGQVLVLAPQSPPLLLRVANFYFLIGENKHALPITAHILRLIPDYDSIIFSEYTRLVDQPEEVLLYGIPEDRRAAKSWLQYLMQAGRLNDAQRTWAWVARHGYDDDSTAGEYAAFLVQQRHPDSAVLAWVQHLGAGAGDYRKANELFNGSFEFEVNPSPFDWDLGHGSGVEVVRDCASVQAWACSLRIRFAGTQNLDVAAASQLVLVQPGRYHFHAAIRTEDVTTNEGIRFRVSDAEVPSRLGVVFGQFVGTTSWSAVEYDLMVPAQTRLLRVQVIRQPSMKFDNKISGTAWIADMRLEHSQ